VGLLMLNLFGIGKQRTLQAAAGGFSFAVLWVNALQKLVWRAQKRLWPVSTVFASSIREMAINFRRRDNFAATPDFMAFSTGC
jgi:hypothetical protein